MAYCSRITAADLGQVLNYVRRHGKLHLDASALIWVAAQEIPSDLIFSLLVKDVDELSDWDIIDIISALDSPYRDLVAAERDFIRINTTGNAYALFERLRKMGRISSYKRDGGRRFYVVRTRNSSNR